MVRTLKIIPSDPASIPMMTMGVLNEIDHVTHGFFTRQGGVSRGLYASLNMGLGSSDDRDAVMENRARAAEMFGLPGAALLTVHQTHSSKVVTVTEPWSAEAAPTADAMVTDRPDLILGVLAADCVPVLFADRQKAVIGAAHAGWRGAKGGIIAATVAAMTELGACTDQIVAVIGPSIHQRSYEVGEEFKRAFLDDKAANEVLFHPTARKDKWLFDLRDYVGFALGDAGVRIIDAAPGDTAAQPDRFYSYRRSTLLQEPDYGRQLSAIALKPVRTLAQR